MYIYAFLLWDGISNSLKFLSRSEFYNKILSPSVYIDLYNSTDIKLINNTYRWSCNYYITN